MNGKDFERICIDRMKSEETRGRATMSRYGVQGTFIADKVLDLEQFVDRVFKSQTKSEMRREVEAIAKAAAAAAGGWQKMESLPDFEGIIASRGQQFVFDAKVCGDATYGISKGAKSSERQLNHLLTRSKFGGIAFLLIHFTERETKATKFAAETWAFPVHPDHPIWISVAAGQRTRITKQDCAEWAVRVEWNCSKGSRTERPDILDAICRMAEGNYFMPAAAEREPCKPF